MPENSCAAIRNLNLILTKTPPMSKRHINRNRISGHAKTESETQCCKAVEMTWKARGKRQTAAEVIHRLSRCHGGVKVDAGTAVPDQVRACGHGATSLAPCPVEGHLAFHAAESGPRRSLHGAATRAPFPPSRQRGGRALARYSRAPPGKKTPERASSDVAAPHRMVACQGDHASGTPLEKGSVSKPTPLPGPHCMTALTHKT